MALWPGIRRRLASMRFAFLLSPIRRIARRFIRFVYGARLIVFNYGTRLIAFVLPERWWYPVLWRVSRFQAFVLAPFIRFSPARSNTNPSVITTWLLNSWMLRMTSIKCSFPIPIRYKGEEALLEASRNPRGMLLCSAHMPLVEACIRPLLEMNCSKPACVDTILMDGEYPVWGSDKRLPGILCDEYVLVRVRSVLRKGGAVALLIDSNFCRTYCANVFQLSRAVGAQVVCAVAELQPDGYILVEYFSPPDPFCTSPDSILLNLQALQTRVDSILQSSPESAPARDAPADADSASLSASANPSSPEEVSAIDNAAKFARV